MSLGDVRANIDAIDRQLRDMLNERARLAQEAGRLKGAGDGFRPEREAEVLRAAIAGNEGPLDDDQLARIMREVMSACLRLESPVRVAYLGPEGSHTHAALDTFFGSGVQHVPASAIGDVFLEVEKGRAAYGIVPIENNTQGIVGPTLDALIDSDLNIVGEVTRPIHHHLMVNGALDVIRAHPQAFMQCRQWLEAHHPDVRRVEVSSTSEAARLARDEGGGAIGSRRASELFGLHLLASRIEDDPRNRTRFIVLGTRTVAATGQDKTSIVLAARNRPGALMALLEPFASAGIDIGRIQSRPSSGTDWQDHFFLDLAGHPDDGRLGPALDAAAREAAFYKLLGAYPVAVV